METLEFIIYPDGRVEERVTGIIGSSCAEVTAAIEAKLGIVAHRELTSENFAQQQVTSQSATQLDRVSDTEASDFSQW
ncbi:cellulase M [Pseudanabaena sp. lw0831]|uniref:DUF2997 domain-containing protein n=1 Tax=Pseudanabaena sp. lw0831 TaxID=1357935 RepID=UPI001916C6A3|nr:DUF2997 domain-containing protein [Pseudanabaena sp. lw0831]GBO54954.1 cellulase M [Pseudanabaena sp. lw0831]